MKWMLRLVQLLVSRSDLRMWQTLQQKLSFWQMACCWGKPCWTHCSTSTALLFLMKPMKELSTLTFSLGLWRVLSRRESNKGSCWRLCLLCSCYYIGLLLIVFFANRSWSCLLRWMLTISASTLAMHLLCTWKEGSSQSKFITARKSKKTTFLVHWWLCFKSTKRLLLSNLFISKLRLCLLKFFTIILFYEVTIF